MLNRNTKHEYLWLAASAVALLSTGCRSMPGRNLFAFGGGPSAEALAGTGPTATYPAPPSATATPEAIASIAGGTTVPGASTASASSPATAQVAGFDISPGYATPASNALSPPSSAVNRAAAQANGIYGNRPSANAPTPSKTTRSPGAPSGYTFGSKALTPKTTNPAPPSAPSTPAWTKNAAFTPAAGGFAPPAGRETAPSSAPAKSGGFTLPTDSPAVAAITLPSKAPTEWKPEPTAAATAFAPPAAASPEFSTASTATVSVPSTETTGLPNATDAAGNYTPGSTGVSSGYPTGNTTPTTQGSFYR